MEARTVNPQQLADMLGVCKKTATRLMRKHPRCLNIGCGEKEYLRLPVDDAEDIVSGRWSLISAKEPKPREVTPPKPKPNRRARPLGRQGEGSPFVQYR